MQVRLSNVMEAMEKGAFIHEKTGEIQPISLEGTTEVPGESRYIPRVNEELLLEEFGELTAWDAEPYTRRRQFGELIRLSDWQAYTQGLAAFDAACDAVSRRCPMVWRGYVSMRTGVLARQWCHAQGWSVEMDMGEYKKSGSWHQKWLRKPAEDLMGEIAAPVWEKLKLLKDRSFFQVISLMRQHATPQEQVLEALEKVQNIHQMNENSNTLLMEACAWKKDKVAARLLERGADIHAANGSGQTALHVAVQSRCAGCVKMLLQAGANPNVRDSSGNTPLMRTDSTTPSAIYRLMAKAGADIHVRNDLGFSFADICRGEKVIGMFEKRQAGKSCGRDEK